MVKERVVTREVLPQSLREFYSQARRHTFAAGVTPVENPLIWGAKGLSFSEGNLYYYDRYFDNPQRPGNFAGIEIVSEAMYGGKPLAVYTYGGGLREQGLKLGEEVVYPRLQKFLRENAQTARFGRNVRDLMADEIGVWIYESKGLVADWGWADVEYINLNGRLVYDFQGQGICLEPGF